MERFSVINSIVSRVSDYRVGDIDAFDYDHVERWIEQFADICDGSEQLIILQEIDRMLQKYYVSSKEAKAFIELVLETKELTGGFVENHREIEFLDIQRNGKSQKELLSLLDEVMEEKYNISRDDCNLTPKKYIYFDDCMFSGNTLIYDIKDWIEDAVPNSELHFVFFGLYVKGLRYSNKKIKEWADEKNIKLTYWKIHEFGADQHCKPFVVTGDRLIDEYVATIDERYQGGLFRTSKINKEGLFSSENARNVVEKAFLRKGSYIITLPRNQKREMRPMGYDKLQTLGFGAMFVTYRNISNNCPLVLWWGDPSYDDTHPLGNWYPLFLRKANTQVNENIPIRS
jgi:hypothetical protein